MSELKRQKQVLGILAGLFVVATSGWLVAGSYFDFRLEKAAVPLRQPLASLTQTLGDYEFVEEVALHESVVRKLGANEQVTRVYVTSAVPRRTPGAAMRLHLAYYTGHEPTLRVKHVPEVCYLNFGFRGKDTHRGSVGLATEEAPISVFRFQPEDGDEEYGVAYCFIANGELCGSPEAVVTVCRTGDAKTAYFLKIELLPGTLVDAGTGEPEFRPAPASQQEILQGSQRFLTALMPELRRLLPEREP